MTRAAHLLPHNGVGGVEIAASSMAQNANPARFRLFLIARQVDGSGSTSPTSGYRSALSPLSWIRVARDISVFNPDVLIFSLWKSVPPAFLAKLMRPRMRLAYTLNLAQPDHLVDRVASTAAFLIVDEVWSDSEATERNRKPSGIKGRLLRFILTNPTAATGASPRPMFVTWCRLNPQKGLDRAIKLMAELRKIGINPQFDIYGPDDGEGKKLQSLVNELDLSQNIAFKGVTSPAEIAVISNHYSFFLMPSRMEGMAMSTVEAMQLGLVPIVTAVGEMARYVRHQENGLIVDPDQLGETAKALRRMIDTPDDYARLRKAALAQWRNSPTYQQSVDAAIRALAGEPNPNWSTSDFPSCSSGRSRDE